MSVTTRNVPGNSLATVEQLEFSNSQADGIPADLEDSIRFAGARSIQMAGILLRLPQDVIAQATVIFTKFWIGPDGGSMKKHSVKDVSAAALYLTAKLSAYPKSPRSVLNVFAYLQANASTYADPSEGAPEPDPAAYHVTEGTYQNLRSSIMTAEAHILRKLGFHPDVQLPHTMCVNYLQALGVFDHSSSSELTARAFAHLNAALFSPQLLYLTHQPSALATAAIYLAAKEVQVKLPGENWWEVFDTDREELGFLVVGFQSMSGFVLEEKARWATRKVPLTIDELETELRDHYRSNGTD